jgi:SNF2 family DNA or RNA helicase
MSPTPNKNLAERCPFCGKIAKEIGRDTFGTQVFILLECSHTIIREIVKSEEIEMVSSDGRRPFPFQLESVKFLEEAECNGMILHEQGLGKTIIECLLLTRNPRLLPTLLVVKSGLRAQWFAEIFRWTGRASQVITSSRELPLFEYFDIIIVSLDTLRLLRPDCKPLSEMDKERLRAQGKRIPNQTPIWTDEICSHFKHICVDESHKIKNPNSSRTEALRLIVKAANGGVKPPIVMLSGTNIEKHAGEFFVTLNMTRPEMFYNIAQYHQQWCEMKDGRIAGIKNPERWKEYTSHFILRYTRAQVMPELPKVMRQFRLCEIEGDELKAYIKVVKEFQKAEEDPEVNLSQSDILGYMSKMRHITGIAKVNAALEFIEEFLLEAEGRKLVIFLHHKLAGAILMEKLTQLCKDGGYAAPLYLSGELNALTQRPQMVEEFKKPGNRLMVASTLASAEGLNMQFVTDCLFMERQWNPSTEEQAEGRFPRPRPEDPWPADAKINAHYLIAAGTIDDFFTELVEFKRRNVKQTLDGEEMVWDEKNLLVELRNQLLSKGLKKWSL